MELTVRWNGKDYTADTDQPIHISIPLQNGFENQPNALVWNELFISDYSKVAPFYRGIFNWSFESIIDTPG